MEIIMKILYAASTISHINNFHKSYIEALRRDGNEVLVMAKGEGADFDIPFVKKMLSPKNSSCRKQIKKIVKDGGFDAIILNTSLAAFHIRMAIPKKERPRVINIVHGYLFEEKSSSLKKHILLLCEKILADKTDSILVMNKEDLSIAATSKLSLNPPVEILGMGAKTAPPKATSDEIRALMQSKDCFVMAFVGELSDRKNQRMLIEALPEIKTQIPRATLWLIGEGDKKADLIELAEKLKLSDSVVFAGRRDNPCDFIRASDVYVSASKIEGMPFNIIEALGTGKTVICSDIKGHRDLINDGEEGYLYPVDDTQAFASKVLDVYNGAAPSEEKIAAMYSKYEFSNVFDSTYLAIREALEK